MRFTMRSQLLASVLLAALLGAAATGAGNEGAAGRGVLPEPPFGLPPVPIPATNPPTPAKVVLGEQLFFDARLSSDGKVSCASCHVPDRLFSDELSISPGVDGGLGRRNTPSVLNTAYLPAIFWDGRSPDLEDQVRYPVVHPKEMNMQRRRVVEILQADPLYRARFLEAFGDGEITFDRVSQAIATFERTLLSGNSPFDRFFFGGEEGALSAEARRGWELFRGRLGCIRCHSFDAERPFFTDGGYHNTGIGYDAITPDLGRFRVSAVREEKGSFRTPGLRDVAATAPYMHDGSLKSLDEVLDFYVRGGLPNLYIDPMIQPLTLSEQDRKDLLRFLESLGGETTTYRSAKAGSGAQQEGR
jgi:cytochrome c peroxidase